MTFFAPQGKSGNTAAHVMALATEALVPEHTYVPWVTINGVHTEEINTEAQTDLRGLVCKTWKGRRKPPGCKGPKERRSYKEVGEVGEATEVEEVVLIDVL